MTTLLQIHTSLNGADSLSSSLAGEYVSLWQTRSPQGRLIVRDLTGSAIPHLDAETFNAFTTDPAQRSATQRAAVALSDDLVAELQAADEIALAVPMHNFGIPSTLKAYFDHIARAGITFRYTPSGPVGLLEGKRMRVFASRGGRYQGTPLDTQTAYLTNFLAFVGIDDIEFVYMEGTAMGDDNLRAAIDGARGRIAELTAQAA